MDKKKKILILVFSFLCGGFIGLAVGLIYIKKLEEKNTEIEPVKPNKEIPERNDANKLLENGYPTVQDSEILHQLIEIGLKKLDVDKLGRFHIKN